MRFHPRFTIRTLLILTALVAAACYCWIARPTIVAKRFMRAIDVQDFALADSYRVGGVDNYFSSGIAMSEIGEPTTIDVVLLPRSWTDLARGRRRMQISINV